MAERRDNRTIKLAPDLELSIDAVTQTFAILGKRGRGKTNTAVVLAEELIGRTIARAEYEDRSTARLVPPKRPTDPRLGNHAMLVVPPMPVRGRHAHISSPVNRALRRVGVRLVEQQSPILSFALNPPPCVRLHARLPPSRRGLRVLQALEAPEMVRHRHDLADKRLGYRVEHIELRWICRRRAVAP